VNERELLDGYLLLGGLLFAIGLVGFLVRRNLIVMFLCAEMMLQGVAVSLVAWSRFRHNWDGQSMVLFIIAIAACEAAVGLALILALFQRSRTLDVAYWQDLREPGQSRRVDRGVPEERREERIWPRLTPAGVMPREDQDKNKETHRARV